MPPYSDKIMLKRKRIRKELLAQDIGWIDKRIAILGGSTTHDIKDMLELFLLHYGIRPTFYESDYNQYWQDVMFTNVDLQKFKPDIIYIHTSNRNIIKYPALSDSKEEVEGLLESTYKHFSDMWDKIKEVYASIVIQNNFEYPYWRLQGNREATDIHGSVYFITRLNLLFAEYAQKHNRFFINDINYLASSYGIEKWSNPFYWYMYKYALEMPAIPYLAQSVSNIIKSIYGKNKKAFALDLDNTLWGGVVGDDGPENLKIGQETSIGQIYAEFQEYLKAHRQLGVILNVISKNNEKNVIDGLNHPDMYLKPDDFISIKANWEPKSKNLAKMAQELSLTPDAFVFVDDNPAEREIIRQQIRKAAVPEMGSAPEGYIRAIDRMGYFEVTLISDEDVNRDKMYHQNVERAKHQLEFADYADFLGSLDMKAEVRSFVPTYYDRISQLSNKTNQFNLTTRRYSQADIQKVAKNDEYISIYGKMKDRFGDNGVVSVVIGHLIDCICDIELWIMSCRVLKRGMEYVMMDELVARCRGRGVKSIVGYYYPTAKNVMVKDFYGLQGFTKVEEDADGNSRWEIAVDSYVPRNKLILVNQSF